MKCIDQPNSEDLSYFKLNIGRKMMGTLTLFMLALGLSMDAFAVSISNGICYGGKNGKQALQTAFAFGLFQALMPIVGYLAGISFNEAIEFIDHWIAFGLLGIIGGKCQRTLSFRTLILQAIATSIDALAVGIGFAIMNVNIVTAASFIGVITFVCCMIGSFLGKKFGAVLEHKAVIFGGIVLILIGLKILLEHLIG